MRAALAVVPLLLVALACERRAPVEGDGVDEDVLSHLPRHEAQRALLCGRARDNAVTRALCSDDVDVRSLADLQDALAIGFHGGDDDDLPGFSLLSHSSALPVRSVTSINPGVVIVSLPAHPPELNGRPGRLRTDGNVLSLAFARGDQLVEMIVKPPDGDLAFYLLRYEKECDDPNDDDTDGCGFASLLTPETERDWTRWSLYDDDDLSNSVLDCLHCHQPQGPGAPRIFRMQELENPWTHWMAPFTVGGRVIFDDYVDAHGLDEEFAGIPGRLLPRTDPVTVEDLVRFSGSEQPNVFPSPFVEREVQTGNRAQPADNSTPGVSPSWDLVYEAAVTGSAIPPPYHDVKTTDAAKLGRMSAAYHAFLSGETKELPDIRDVVDDDALAHMSVRPKPGLDGRGILVHMCGQCHNARLDQSLSRAQFDAIDLDKNTRAEKQLAIQRMLLPVKHRDHMPPHLFRELSDEEITAATKALEQ
ncbi:MAG: hypothetical protein Q8O67_16820 [Deltaproteobacteria bacterium]|nr:hypothetical protein [Deltaproteobacteria bacterium]